MQPSQEPSHQALPDRQLTPSPRSARRSPYLAIRAAQARTHAQTAIAQRPNQRLDPSLEQHLDQHLDQTEETLVDLHVAPPARRVRRDELVDTSSVLAPIELPKQPRLPFGLRLLHRVQQGSTVLTGLLVTSALVAYGSSVYIDRSTNQALAQLNALQSESQQLTTANESIKQSLAEQAIEENSGLEPYAPDDMLFITPEPRRAPVKDVEEKKPTQLQPLGY
ncbi:hypothetical protein [cf. Phormidesmis sp. LEGE 11477]|uniref:hypothetical protein n=1 Tax=cf. Phormidesmis sp. LEGE 11477 TaxID=1828680 RepID=UPI0018810478|nr:hypothetical protein [cf. Phormidesmis sp. LEGE 11477]MBE9061327.1 hypothetical protein [cf. Phormidesmis sp. LEGE 11477]